MTHFLACYNAKEAARRCGIPENATARIMRDPVVQGMIEAGLKSITDRLDLKAERVLREAARLASCDVGKMVDPDTGLPLPVHLMPEDVRRCVSGFDVVETTDKRGEVTRTYRVKLWDKNKALELLAKYHRLVTDRPEINVTLSLADLILDAGRAVVTSSPVSPPLPAPSGSELALGAPRHAQVLDTQGVVTLDAVTLEGGPSADQEGTVSMGGPGFEGAAGGEVRETVNHPPPTPKNPQNIPMEIDVTLPQKIAETPPSEIFPHSSSILPEEFQQKPPEEPPHDEPLE